MNKEEFRKHGNPKGAEYYKVHELLNQWKRNNNIPDNIQCVVHHRDDTEECRKYNTEHYEIYGCNPDGTFEYGKYVVFMTNAEHNTYHHKGKTLSNEQKAKLSEANSGEKNGFYGKTHTAEVRQKIREKALGRKITEETKQKLREANIGRKHTEESKQKMREGCLRRKYSEEMKRHIRDAISQRMKNDGLYFRKYKENNGDLPWNEFRKLFHNNDPQVMQYLIN